MVLLDLLSLLKSLNLSILYKNKQNNKKYKFYIKVTYSYSFLNLLRTPVALLFYSAIKSEMFEPLIYSGSDKFLDAPSKSDFLSFLGPFFGYYYSSSGINSESL